MHRLTAAAVACLAAYALLTAGSAVPAAAQPSPSPSEDEPEIFVPEPVPGESVCQITDQRLSQLSGLAAIDDGFVVVNNGVPLGRDDMLPIFFLNRDCQVVAEQGYLPGRPLDPEDLEYDWSRNVLWVGDTGDNNALGTSDGQPRPTVALWRVDLNGDRTPLIHRFTYEDGQPRDAEALILDADGMPIIITRTVGTAELFRPVELVPNNPPEQAVTLEKVGEFTPPDTGSEHLFLPSAAARRTVTGASVSPDGTRVVVRTYTDAFEFDVVDGDVVAAITTGVPRVTPLPDEPQGEAITYTPDGERFLTVSEIPPDMTDFVPEILAYTPAAPPPPAPEPAEEEPGDGAGGGGLALFDSVQDIINLIAAVGVLGLLLVAAGVFGIVRARRRWAQESDAESPGEPSGPVTGRARPATAEGRAEGRARPPGAAAPGAAAAGAATGWEQRSPGESTGGVYSSSAARGGDPYEGTEYGGDAYQDPGYQDPGYQGTEYQGTEYRAAGYGSPGGYEGDYPADGYAGAGQAEGYDPGYGEYGAPERPDGYPAAGYGGDEPFDQDWPADQRGHGYHQGDAYAGDGYQQEGYHYPAGEGYPASGGYPQGEAAGTYRGGSYQDDDADYYSDDPDYRYEFRDRDRW